MDKCTDEWTEQPQFLSLIIQSIPLTKILTPPPPPIHWQLFFLPMPLAVARVFRLTFSPSSSSSPSPHHQLFVSLRYSVGGGGVGPWLCIPSCLNYSLFLVINVLKLVFSMNCMNILLTHQP